MQHIPSGIRRTLVPTIAALSLLSLVSCDDGGGGVETITLRLDTDADCYGIVMEVPTSQASEVTCDLDPSLVAAGCSVDLDTSAQGLELSVHGCFAGNGDALVACVLPSSVVDQIHDSAEVRCGCGCADDCPDSPSVSVCDEDGAGCVVAAAHAASVASTQQTPSSVSSRGISVSSTATCETCCDAGVDSNVRLVSGEDIREIRFEFDAGRDGGVNCNIESCSFPQSLTGPRSEEFISDNRRRICIADPSGLDAGQLLLSCTVFTGGNIGNVFDVSALGDDLEPVSPPPVVETEEP